jgi:hypothetical protein
MDEPTGHAAPEGDRRRKNLEQWRHARIDRFIRRQWQVRDWINFGDVADFCARETGSITPDEEKRARAYDELADALIKGEFDRDDRSRVLYLHPSSKKARMTWEWFSDVFRFNIDGNRGQSEFLPYCWAPRAMMERFFEKRRLPTSPAFFAPRPGAREPATRKSCPKNARSAPPHKLGKNERKRLAVDAAIKELGVDVFADMTQKARRQAVEQRAGPKLGGLTVSDRYVSERLTVAKAEREERS